MLEVVAKMFRSQPSAKIDALAKQVVEESVAGVALLVADRMERMTLSEARGYVRARSHRIVRRHTSLALSRHSKTAQDWSAAIVRAATERLIPLVLRETGVGLPRRTGARVAA